MSTKVMVAGLVAAVGVAWCAWTVASTGRTHVPRPASNVAGGVGPGAGAREGAGEGAAPTAVETRAAAEPGEAGTFARITGEADVERLLSEGEAAIGSLARQEAGLTALGVAATDGFARAASVTLRPYLLGSRERLIEAVRALGGTPPEVAAGAGGEGARPMPLLSLLQHASIDFSRARVIPRVVRGDDVEGREMRERMGRDDARSAAGTAIPGTTGPSPGGVGPAGRGAAEPEMEMRMVQRGLFPDVDDAERKRLTVYEVRAPILLEGVEKPSGMEIGVRLAWDAPNARWQPAGFTIYSKDPRDAAVIQGRMRGSR